MRQHQILKKYIQGLSQGLNTSLIVVSPAGFGKTETTLKALEELNYQEGRNYLYVANYITPRALVELLERVNGLEEPRILILDDCDDTLRNLQAVGVLKSALWEAGGKRKVYWITTREKKEFEFQGRIIFLLNQMRKSAVIQALKDRSLYFEMDLSLQDLFELMRERAELPYQNIPLNKRREIANFLAKVGSQSQNISLRTLEKAYNLYLLSPNHYQQLIYKIL